MRRRSPLLVALALVLALAVAPSATAAVSVVGELGEPGQECGFGSRSATTFAAPDYEIPIDGAIIEWSFQTGPTAPSPQSKMKVLSVAGNQYTVVGESLFGLLAENSVNTFDVDIPVKRGDLLGLFTGEAGSHGQCFVHDQATTPEEALLGDPLVGETRGSSGTVSEARFPMSAVVLPAPTVIGIDPASGPTAGGTTVTILGSDLRRVKSVSFGGLGATSFEEKAGGASLTAVAPAAAAGTVDVQVTTAAGQSPVTGGDRFTYAAPAPPAGGGSGSGSGEGPGPTGGGSGQAGGGSSAGGSTGSSSSPPAAGSPAPAPVAPSACKVPSLKGKKVAAARRAIRAAGCAVGKVRSSHRRGRGAARVRSQSPKAGRSVAAGAPVRIRVG